MGYLPGHLPPGHLALGARKLAGTLFQLISHPVVLSHKLANLIATVIAYMFVLPPVGNRSHCLLKHTERPGNPFTQKNCHPHHNQQEEQCKVYKGDNQVRSLFCQEVLHGKIGYVEICQELVVLIVE